MCVTRKPCGDRRKEIREAEDKGREGKEEEMKRVELSGAEIVVEELKHEGVEVAFGIPGGALLDLYHVLYEEKDIRHILMLSLIHI